MRLCMRTGQPEDTCTNLMSASDAFHDMRHNRPIILMHHLSPCVNACSFLLRRYISDMVFESIVTPYHISGSKIKQAGHDMG